MEKLLFYLKKIFHPFKYLFSFSNGKKTEAACFLFTYFLGAIPIILFNPHKSVLV